MGHRSKNPRRCGGCRMPESVCVCEFLVKLRLETRLVLVAHYKELQKTTATGPLALAALENSALYVHGLRNQALDLEHLHDESRRVLVLFPTMGARTLTSTLRDEDPRPITLVVPDGSWRQASRIPRRVAGLARAEPVMLPPGSMSSWGVRRETRETGLATCEAIARALGCLESKSAEATLDSLFDRLVETTFAVRGHDRNTPGQLVHARKTPRRANS